MGVGMGGKGASGESRSSAAAQGRPAGREVAAPAGTARERGLGRTLAHFGLATLSVAVVRGLVALSRWDEFRLEEIYIGSFGLALREGLTLDPERLPIIVHLRGSVVFGALAYLLSFVTGPSILLLKTLAVGWSALTAGALYLAVERGLHSTERGAAVRPATASEADDRSRRARRAAATAVAAYAFLPPSFQMVDVLALGSHGDVPLFLFAALAALFWRPGPLGVARAALFGFFVGLGSLFSLHFVVALPALALAWWLHDRRGFVRVSFLVFLAVAGLAAAPMRLLSRSATLVQKSFGEHFFPDGAAGVWDKLARTIPGDLTRAWLFADNGGAPWTWVFGLALAVGLAALAPRIARAEPLALFALLYPLSVLGAYAISDFELNLLITKAGMGSRYFMPMLPLFGVAVALAAWSPAPRAAALGRVAALAFVAAGCAGWIALLDPGVAAARPPMRASSYPHFWHLQHGAGPTFENRLAWARRLDPDWDATRYLRYEGLNPKAERVGALSSPEELVAAAVGSGEATQAQVHLAAEIGYALGMRAQREPALVLEVLGKLAESQAQEPLVAAFERGVGKGVTLIGVGDQIRTAGRRMNAFRMLAQLGRGSPPRTAERLAEGAGYQLGLVFTPYNENYEQVLARGERELVDPFAEPFFRGLAVGWRLRFFEASWRPPAPGVARIERQVPARFQPLFRAGLEAPVDALDAW